jgi:hypothetical protein
VRAILTSVIFADGQFVGMAEHGALDQFVKEIKAITEAGNLAKIGAWDQIEALAQAFLQEFVHGHRPTDGEDYIVYTFRQIAATQRPRSVED